MLFELDSLRTDQQKQIEQLKKEQAVLEHQLEKEKNNYENEKSKRVQQERDNQGPVQNLTFKSNLKNISFL